jgi:uncharacterized protein
MYPKVITNFNAFIGGTSYLGLVRTAKLPDLKLKTEDYRGGGMDGHVAQDMGMEAMSAEVTFAQFDPRLITTLGTRQSLVLRPAARGHDGSVDAIIVTLRGRWTGIEGASLEPGKAAELKLTCAADYFRYQHNFKELVEIDVQGGVRMIGGVDQMAAMRKAMGV